MENLSTFFFITYILTNDFMYIHELIIYTSHRHAKKNINNKIKTPSNETLPSPFPSWDVWGVTGVHHILMHTRKKETLATTIKKTTIKWNFPFCFYFFRGLANHMYSLYTHHTYTQKKNINNNKNNKNTFKRNFSFSFHFFGGLASHMYSSYTHHTYKQKKKH